MKGQMKDSPKLRLAIIGCRGAARDYAAQCDRLRGADFVAVADPMAANARPLAEQLNASIVAESLEELLRTSSAAFDAVIVDSPGSSRDADSMIALQAGKHLMTPLPATAGALDVLDATCRPACVRLMFAAEARFSPAATAVREAIDAGQLGQPGLLRIHHWESSNDDCDSALSAQLLKEIDLSHWFFESIPNSIHCEQSSVASSESDYIQIHLGFPCDAMAMIDVTTGLPRGDSYRSLSLIGSSGAAYADDHHNVQLLYRGGGPPAALKTGDGGGTLALLQEFVDAIRENRDPMPGIDDAKRMFTVMSAVERCLEAGRPMRLEGDRYEFV